MQQLEREVRLHMCKLYSSGCTLSAGPTACLHAVSQVQQTLHHACIAPVSLQHTWLRLCVAHMQPSCQHSFESAQRERGGLACESFAPNSIVILTYAAAAHDRLSDLVVQDH